jgi:hypothetical protein
MHVFTYIYVYIYVYIYIYKYVHIYFLYFQSNGKTESRQDIGAYLSEDSLDVTYALLQQLVPGNVYMCIWIFLWTEYVYMHLKYICTCTYMYIFMTGFMFIYILRIYLYMQINFYIFKYEHIVVLVYRCRTCSSKITHRANIWTICISNMYIYVRICIFLWLVLCSFMYIFEYAHIVVLIYRCRTCSTEISHGQIYEQYLYPTYMYICTYIYIYMDGFMHSFVYIYKCKSISSLSNMHVLLFLYIWVEIAVQKLAIGQTYEQILYKFSLYICT